MSEQEESNDNATLPPTPPSTGKFLLFSDTHLDPFYGTANAKDYRKRNPSPCQNKHQYPYSYYGCEANRQLVTSAMVNAAQILPNPDFILFTGDATRHSLYSSKLIQTEENVRDTVHDTINFVLQTIQKAFPDIPLLKLPPMNLGNNDFTKDYELEITSMDPCLVDKDGNLPNATNPWLEDLAQDFESLFVSKEEEATFACGGYFMREMKEDLHLIVLNTVLWSTELDHHKDQSSFDYDFENAQFDPFGMHAWLETMLSQLRSESQKVYITGHIPPVVMSYTEALGENLMYEHHVNRFYTIISQYTDIVSGLFFGHLHSNELRKIPIDNFEENPIPPMMVSGSLSPIYASNPVFHVVSYDHEETQYPLDVMTYSADLENGNVLHPPLDHILEFKPQFNSLLDFLGMDGFTNFQVDKIAAEFVEQDLDPTLGNTWDRYWNQWYKGIPQSSCNDDCRLEEACVIACGMTTESYQTCRWNKPTASNPDHNAPNVVNLCTLPSGVYTETNTNTHLDEEEISPPLKQNQSSQESNSNSGNNVAKEATIGVLVAILVMIFICWAFGNIVRWCQRKKRDLIPLEDINIDTNIDLDSTFSGKEGGRSLDLSLPAIT